MYKHDCKLSQNQVLNRAKNPALMVKSFIKEKKLKSLQI